jgi:5-formyltetrahydrofolate cyclo-ligase
MADASSTRSLARDEGKMNSPMQTEWSGRHPGKDQLRAEVWSRLVEQAAAGGQPFGHIPNFKGADQAAEQLAGLSIWQQARVIKSNPDSPQQPVRWRALRDGKKLYMAVPRLTQERLPCSNCRSNSRT